MRQCSVKSPVARRTVNISSTLNIRQLCPASAKTTIESRCSCRSPVGPGGPMGGRQTCDSEEKPVLLRPTMPPPSPGCARCRGPFQFCGVVAVPQTTGYECGCPNLPVFSGPCSCSSHQSLHCFADGTPRSQCTSAFPAHTWIHMNIVSLPSLRPDLATLFSFNVGRRVRDPGSSLLCNHVQFPDCATLHLSTTRAPAETHQLQEVTNCESKKQQRGSSNHD